MALQSMTALASITLQQTSASVSFSGIPQNYRDLVLVVNAISTSNTNLDIRLNSDTSSSYPEFTMSNDGTGNWSVATTRTFLRLDYGGFIGTSSGHLNIIEFIDYSSTTKHKGVLARAGNISNGVSAIAGRWSNTSGINTILLMPTFSAGSTIDLYGRIA